MQEQVNEKTVALYIKGGKITGQLLAQAMKEFLRKSREPPKEKKGLQSVKTLTKQGASLSNFEIDGSNIGDFRKTARKYNVAFALKRDDSETPPKWLVIFKAKDTDTLTAAFNEYSKIQMKYKGKKPSMIDKINKFKKIAKAVEAPVKNKNKGERDL
jgi:hypothetical protein